ncbi:fungal-specific transcription factor domain-containing protein [Ilyonectria destructans]|nr:fungal-specific transcription factor domain-containing protein [Ilyonectria destructans]
MDTQSEAEALRRPKLLQAVQACVRCQEKKARCDGNKPSCQSCAMRGKDCVYRGVRKRRGPGKGKKHIQVLEERLSEMESLLNRSSLLQRPENLEAGRETSLRPEHSPTALPGCTTNVSSSSFVSESNAHPAWNQKQPSTDSAEPSLGHIETFQAPGRILISQGIMSQAFRRIDERLNEFKAVGNPMSLGDVVVSPALPGELERQLLCDSIGDICNEFPLFHLPWLINRLRQSDSLERHNHQSWWASLNTLIAIAIVSKSINSSFSETYLIAWAFFKNAYAVFPDLVLRGNELLTVQSFLAMAMFLMSSADTRTTVLILSIAVRELQAIDLYGRMRQTTSVDPVAYEIRTRVIWVAYILDIEMSSNCGLPPLQSDEDIEINLPRDKPLDDRCGIDDSKELCSAKIFRLRAELATIQSRIRRELYTAKSRRQSTDQLLRAVRDLDFALEHWRSTTPVEVELCDGAQNGDSPLDKPVISLCLTYHHCVSMVHWAVLQSKSQQATLDAPSRHDALPIPRLQVTASTAKVRVAAIATIALIQRLSPLLFAELWRFLRYPISACIALLTRVLDDPADAEAQSDLTALRWFRQFIEKMITDEACDLTKVLRGCLEMEKIASTAIADTAMEPESGRAAERSSDPPLNERCKAVASILSATAHPMFVAQGLMGNLPNSDADAARVFSNYLGMSWEASSPYGSFVPGSLRPEPYGFIFESRL